jgi:hypothetical protein
MMTRGFSKAGGHAARLAIVSCTALIAVAVVAGGAGAPSATAAAAPKVCREAGITLGVVHKVFGPTGRIGGEGDSETGRCALQSGVGGQPPSNCGDGPPTCTNTDVMLQPASAFSRDVATEVEYLNDYGHAHKTKFSGAGPEAALYTSTTGYGSSNPAVLFKAGPKTVSIAGPFAGAGQTRAVYNQWEALARKIYAHLNR